MGCYECYIFAWNEVPDGGAWDLIMCCDTIKEGKIQAKNASEKFDVVQLMSSDGEMVDGFYD